MTRQHRRQPKPASASATTSASASATATASVKQSSSAPKASDTSTSYSQEQWLASLAELTHAQLQLQLQTTTATSSLRMDAGETELVLLHVIRILALYLFVLLSQHTFTLAELLPSSTTQFVEATVEKLEAHVHATLLACVRVEMDSNQFDGVIQERRVVAALKRVFRDRKLKAKTQCQVLVRLLFRSLAALRDTPIVRCEPVGMLASTLEYLSTSDATKASSKSLLYPLVNAIDSLSIEQRECLDALTTLWKWLAACDPSESVCALVIESEQRH
ncbi:hypothetical protein PINS_up002623 [Pythium insidiosum]|nr:hypothetical protein PINS_up002623 [Pythium insidiosum]